MDQLINLIKNLTLSQRVSVLIAVLIAGAGIAGLLHYRHESDFRPLYTAMAPEDAAPVAQKLKESGVEYRLADNGSVILVPSERLAESRLTLAAVGLPKSGRIGFELFDKTNFGATELVEHINYQRALEGELERSVMSMAEVTQARVHLTFSRESVFLDQQQPAKASVMVKLRANTMSPQNVLAITHLVSSAVPGLGAEGVAVLDMDGNLLSKPRRPASSETEVTSESLEVRQAMEHELVAKINTTLEPLLGADQFRAGASVDCDLTSSEQQEETFSPDKSVMLTSQKTEDTTDRGVPAGGIPGTAANLPKPANTSPGTAGSTSHRTENVTYQSSRVVKHTKIPQGVIKRMSLSVLVGQPLKWTGTGKNRKRVAVPPTAETMKTIRDLVAGVTGLDAERGDQLIVETLPFESADLSDSTQATPGSPATENTNLPKWLDALTKNKNFTYIAIGGGVLLLVLIGVGIKFLLPRKAAMPKGQVVNVTDQLGAAAATQRMAAPDNFESLAEAHAAQQLLVEAHAETADRVRQFSQKEPAVAANVLRVWLQDRKA